MYSAAPPACNATPACGRASRRYPGYACDHDLQADRLRSRCASVSSASNTTTSALFRRGGAASRSSRRRVWRIGPGRSCGTLNTTLAPAPPPRRVLESDRWRRAVSAAGTQPDERPLLPRTLTFGHTSSHGSTRRCPRPRSRRRARGTGVCRSRQTIVEGRPPGVLPRPQRSIAGACATASGRPTGVPAQLALVAVSVAQARHSARATSCAAARRPASPADISSSAAGRLNKSQRPGQIAPQLSAARQSPI